MTPPRPPYVAPDRQGLSSVDQQPLAAPKMSVSVFPGDQNYQDNIIFDRSWILNSGWCEAMVALREQARAQGIELGTADRVPMEQSDIILFVNLPTHRAAVEQIRQRYPRALLVLIASESPVVQPHAAVRSNHQLFDRVFTLKRLKGDPMKYHRLPAGCAFVPNPAPADIPFTQRRFAILVNSNVNSGLLRASRPLNVFDQGRTIRNGGWSLPLQRQLQVSLGSRYHLRRRFARAAEGLDIADFDLYGQGWEPLRSGWFHRFFPESPWRQWRGPLNDDKLHSLSHYRFAFCYENFAGSEGSISEKVFDALAAGTVPLCHGDRHLRRWIPASCAVFRDDYSSDRELLRDLLRWDEARWRACRDAGQAFLRSDGAAPFLANAYAEDVLRGLRGAVEATP